jgi:hypothetical protein
VLPADTGYDFQFDRTAWTGNGYRHHENIHFQPVVPAWKALELAAWKRSISERTGESHEMRFCFRDMLHTPEDAWRCAGSERWKVVMC